MLRVRESAPQLDRIDVGSKARRLAAAGRMGLPIPDGIIVLPDEQIDERRLVAALAELAGGRPVPLFAVRSSATGEDLPGHSAAGLFLSRTHVPTEQVPAAIREVRDSGRSPAVLRYCGGEVPVAVLIQPMVAAEQLGVLYLGPDGSGVCEERPADAPEWANVTTRALAADDASPLASGARQLAALVAAEPDVGRAGDAVYIEYAVAEGGGVVFLQVRPAAPLPPAASWPAVAAESNALVFVLDQEHNPDPLSRAQSGLVDGVADLVPTLRQQVFRGYLYYAELPATGTGAAGKPLKLDELGERYAEEIVPACEALLAPLEGRLVAADGALDGRLLAEPALCELSLGDAFAAYRGVYRLYVAQLGPALRRARQQLDQLLRKNLGESLGEPRHSALLAGAAQAPTDRLQQLWELGRAGAPDEHLRQYLARYGAFAACWDIAVPCDDERPEWIRQTAVRLAAVASLSPRELHVEAEGRYHATLSQLLERLPRMARGALKALLPAVRTAQRIAEEDDGLFFRAQRLVRWALLGRGARLRQAGRLDRTEQVFDLPWSLHDAAPFDPRAFAAGLDLRQLAGEGEGERAAARALVPPTRLAFGQPLWAPPSSSAEVLRGCGVPGAGGGVVRGRARVVRSLFPPSAAALQALEDASGPDTILVLPALLPSWAAELWRARALVTDSGGALSHGAILARERGVPAVVGTRVATRSISDGQELWVDAERGRVYLIPAAACDRLPP